ncbi:MAG TPA: response regulator [Candidatus Paceibacterota bacterium]|nr:response regulator [Candidatus Paceibacterota bacterium]
MKKTVLIIEDEADIREAMVDYLSESDYKVLAASDGITGLQTALAEHPDLILLDLMLPAMNGQEVLRKLREDRWGKNAVVIIMSAQDDLSNIGMAYESGVTEYIMKSNASLEELSKKVRETLLANS